MGHSGDVDRGVLMVDEDDSVNPPLLDPQAHDGKITALQADAVRVVRCIFCLSTETWSGIMTQQ